MSVNILHLKTVLYWSGMQVSKAKENEAAHRQKDAYIRKLEARLLNQHKAPGRKLRPGSENSKVATGTLYYKQDTSCSFSATSSLMGWRRVTSKLIYSKPPPPPPPCAHQ